MTTWTPHAPADPGTVRSLGEQLNQSALISELLARRGVVDYDSALMFFRPWRFPLHDPFEMAGMEAAVDRVGRAIERGETVMVYGDYDVDGVCSVAILADFLESRGVRVLTCIPNRFTHGYGLHSDGVREAAEEGASLIVSVDCGITAHEPAEEVSRLGMDLIICDHHLPGETLPPAVAILNPKQEACRYPYPHLSGAGVVFKLVQALLMRESAASHSPSPASSTPPTAPAPTSPADPRTADARIPPELEPYLEFVALSIAADVVPVTGENRILMSMGLKRLNHDPQPGPEILMERTQIPRGTLRSLGIAFSLAPRLNAAGRMGDASLSLQLLRAGSPDTAERLAEQLDSINEQRRRVDADILRLAMERIEREPSDRFQHAIVLHDPGWHEGVLGLVASRLVDRYAKPVLMLGPSSSPGMAKGSGRSVDGFDLHEALTRCATLLERFGGHAAAAGLTLREEHVGELAVLFDQVAGQWWRERERPEPRLQYDAEIPLPRITDAFWRVLDQFEPFGPENPVPVFVSRGVTLVDPPRLLKDQHLKLRVRDGSAVLDAIGFGMPQHHAALEALHLNGARHSGRLDIAYQIQENHFRGRSTLQLLLLDLKVHPM